MANIEYIVYQTNDRYWCWELTSLSSRKDSDYGFYKVVRGSHPHLLSGHEHSKQKADDSAREAVKTIAEKVRIMRTDYNARLNAPRYVYECD